MKVRPLGPIMSLPAQFLQLGTSQGYQINPGEMEIIIKPQGECSRPDNKIIGLYSQYSYRSVGGQAKCRVGPSSNVCGVYFYPSQYVNISQTSSTQQNVSSCQS